MKNRLFALILASSIASGFAGANPATASASSTPNAPANDLFANAIILSGNSLSVQASNVGATKEPGEPNHAGNPGGASVWWSWTAPTNAVVSLSTTVNLPSSLDTLLAVYIGTAVSNLVVVASDDDGGAGTDSALVFNAAAGTTYQIAVDGYYGSTGSFRLQLLAANPTAPHITLQPLNQLTLAGSSATFSVSASGFGQLSYQWQNSRGPILGATNLTLTVTNAHASDGISYSTAVSNAYGSVMSRAAALVLVTPFTSLAGDASAPGYNDAPGRSSRFHYPGSVAVDANGNAYVADTFNHAIRKISPDGTITTLAGGWQGASDGFGTNAGFNFPCGIAVDTTGTIYVADQYNHAVRKISPGGLVTTLAGLAGNKNKGFSDSSGASARFNHPSALALDSEGNIYVADTWNCAIRKITPNGGVTTLAGSTKAGGGVIGSVDGSGTNALFNFPAGMAVDISSNIYVADTGNNAVRMISPAGVVTTLAGMAGAPGGVDGQGTNASFAFPNGLAISVSGALYVADSGNNTIRLVTADGVVTTLAGQAGRAGGTDAAGTNSLFHQPRGLALDVAGNLYVADTLNNSIRVIATNGAASVLAGIGGSAGSDSGTGSLARFYFPNALTMDASGNLYVADLLNFVIRKITPEGAVGVIAGQAGQTGNADGAGTNALFASPSSLAVDAAGNVYVADADNASIRVIAPSGAVSTLAGQGGVPGDADGTGTNASFNEPTGLALDSAGNLYVADSGNNLIRKMASDGTNWIVTTLAGFAQFDPFGNSVDGSANGVGTNASFNRPSALTIDTAGNVFVADAGNEMIRKIGTNGVVTTFAGFAGAGGNVDGSATNARFSRMSGLAIDGAGNIYVADTGNETIRAITPGGVVTTIGGVPDVAGSVDGTGVGALFSLSSGIAVSASGNIYVSAALNNTIRVGVLPPVLQITGGPGGVVIAWPIAPAGFVLEISPALASGATWTTLTNASTVIGGRYVLTNPTGDPARFYRLHAP